MMIAAAGESCGRNRGMSSGIAFEWEGLMRTCREWRIGNNNSLGIRVMNKNMPGVVAFAAEALTAFGAYKG